MVLFNNMANIKAQPLKVMPIAAIVLDKEILTAQGSTKQLTEGLEILVKDDIICDCTEKPTHIITSCHGKLDGTEAHIVAINIKTLHLKRIYL